MYQYENNDGTKSNKNIYKNLRQKDIHFIRQRHFGTLGEANNKPRANTDPTRHPINSMHNHKIRRLSIVVHWSGNEHYWTSV